MNNEKRCFPKKKMEEKVMSMNQEQNALLCTLYDPRIICLLVSVTYSKPGTKRPLSISRHEFLLAMTMKKYSTTFCGTVLNHSNAFLALFMFLVWQTSTILMQKLDCCAGCLASLRPRDFHYNSNESQV